MTEAPLSIVTGGGAGIGRAICQTLARAGDRVLVVDLAAERAEETVALIRADGGDAAAATLDITDEAAVAALIDGAGPIRRLVNNAGIFDVKPFDALTADDFRRMYEVNLVAMAALCQRAAAKMERGSAIVNIASRAMLGAKQYIHYATSKAAVGGFTRSLALELAERGITVNAVAPGVIETDMLRARSDTNLDGLRAMQPGGTLGTPEDIAEAVAFLASDKARFVTGQVLLVDGGRSLGGSLGI
ncbi:SDR family NAD(P)-dependent oxidoreductase [Amorphus orientalis]|uniref:3-oxoacyl-[acyl-carrier protein] reductase n=1 Tax=Amorphus orientalis TaxID=649198 RepID=A0AAE3VMA8_9HYPH|nr:SDR family NAD(P)-dependent oxidoreductase [Amorphus orientalis]MDQ0314572.1 3-oxoacyl-[acyl-carrier protein] reductase [Amorphus orientalis]